MKPGGVMVWVVGDSLVGGSVTWNSFRQALYFREIGFSVHQVLIYEKTGHPFPPSNRYYQQTEYMFVLSKGSPKSVNLLRQKTTYNNKRKLKALTRQVDGSLERMKYKIGNDDRVRDNVWRFKTGGGLSSTDNYGHLHPAIFPEALARDHILSWSNPGDLVLDCFAGSGTTLKMAKMLSREYIGIEISPEYVSIIEKRLLATDVPLFA
jgi:DNA modification methylase